MKNFFAIFKEFQKIQQFKKEFGNVCTNFGIKVNKDQKQVSYLVEFLRLKFYTLKIKACLPKNKLKKPIQKVAKLLEKKISTTNKK